jgi:methylglutaconyl-CoA hydratase
MYTRRIISQFSFQKTRFLKSARIFTFSTNTSSPPPPPPPPPPPTTTAELVIQHGSNGIITLSLNRHSARNALSSSLLSSLSSQLDTFSKLSQTEARCLIIQSTVPRVFCSGADLKERAQLGTSLDAVKRAVNDIRETFTRIEKLNFPTIAVIEGAAMGGGLELALACDLIIASKTATFGLPETTLGIIPGAGGTVRLSRKIGLSASKYLIFTGKKISATEGFEVGLLTELTEEGQAYSTALRIAQSIAMNGPVAIRAAKQSLQDGTSVDINTALQIEEQAYGKVLPTKDRLEGLAAWKEKRLPNFNGE